MLCSFRAELTVKFNNEGFTALAWNSNSQLFGFLLNQDGFIPTHQDYISLLCDYSFTDPSLTLDHVKRRSSCLSHLLSSYRMHVVYASLPFSRKLTLLRAVLTHCHHSVELVGRPYI